MATQAEILTQVRDRLDEPTARQYSDAQIRRWINEAMRDIATRIRWYRTSSTIAAVAGTQTYNFAADCLEVHAVGYQRTGDTQMYDLEYVDLRNLKSETYTHLHTSEGTPQVFWTWGYPGSATFDLGLYPTPSAAGTITVHYYAVPDELNTDTSDANTAVEVPMGYERLVVDYAAYTAFMMDGDPRWQNQKALYEQNMEALQELAVKFTDQTGAIVHGRSRVPYSLYGFDDGDWGW